MLSCCALVMTLAHLTLPQPGVVVGDGVKVRAKPNLKGGVLAVVFRGNGLQILQAVDGEAVASDQKASENKRQDQKWYKVSAPFFYDEGFVHHSFVKVGDERKAYLAEFSPVVHQKRLKKYFSDEQIAKLGEFKMAYHGVKTCADIAKVYRWALQLNQNLAESLTARYDKMQQKNPSLFANMPIAWLYSSLPGMYVEYVAEGTYMGLMLYYPDWLELAKKTPGKSDDLFFQLMMKAYGKSQTYFANWFSQTWDYGGHSMLGTGVHLKVLRLADGALAQSTDFALEIKELKEKALQDILQEKAYSEPGKKIAAELKQIIDQVKWTPEQKKSLVARLKQFSKPPKDLQLNCKKRSCQYG